MPNLPLAEVDISLLADNVGISSTDTLNLSEGVLDLDLAVNVGVEQSVLIKKRSQSSATRVSKANQTPRLSLHAEQHPPASSFRVLQMYQYKLTL